MSQLTIMRSNTGEAIACAVCGKPLPPEARLHLALAGSLAGVCRHCGKQSAPALHALLELADVAERIGKRSHHGQLWLPYEELLQLAREAERYYLSASASVEPPRTSQG